MEQRGATSPSFLIAVVGLPLAVVGYFAWTYLVPDPVKASDELVREIRRSAAREMRACQRAAAAAAEAKDSQVEAVLSQVEKCTEQALARIDEEAGAALVRLPAFKLAERTQRNRSERIDKATRDARDNAATLLEETRRRLAGEPGDGEPDA